MDEWGLPLKSHDTSCSSHASRMPRSLPEALSRNALFTASAVADFSSSATRSTTDTLIVGTRIAIPSSLPLSFGSTRPTAVAAPVVVGIMLTAAARARRRSLCEVVHGLVVRVRVHGRGEATFDAERVVEHLDGRRQTVGR